MSARQVAVTAERVADATPAKAADPPTSPSSACRRKSSHVATPKLPPTSAEPPEQIRVLVRVRLDYAPSGVTSSAPMRLSQVRPCCEVKWPIPPPSVSPPTPVEPTTPPASRPSPPLRCRSRARWRRRPRARRARRRRRGRRAAGTGRSRARRRRRSGPRVVPAAAHGDLEPVRAREVKAVPTSAGAGQRAITAGRRSISVEAAARRVVAGVVWADDGPESERGAGRSGSAALVLIVSPRPAVGSSAAAALECGRAAATLR